VSAIGRTRGKGSCNPFRARIAAIGVCASQRAIRGLARDQLKGAASPWRGCDGRSFSHRLTSGLRCYLWALKQHATQKPTNGASHQKREPRDEPNGNRDDRYGPIWQIFHGVMVRVTLTRASFPTTWGALRSRTMSRPCDGRSRRQEFGWSSIRTGRRRVFSARTRTRICRRGSPTNGAFGPSPGLAFQASVVEAAALGALGRASPKSP
jgi:hypothetical protein